jgi:hypothetical protein
MRPGWRKASRPAPDPDRVLFRRVVWGLLAVMLIAAGVAKLLGIEAFRPGKPLDAEQAWRDRAGR